MSTHLPGFTSFSRFLHHFVLTKLATSSIRVKDLHGPGIALMVILGAFASGACDFSIRC